MYVSSAGIYTRLHGLNQMVMAGMNAAFGGEGSDTFYLNWAWGGMETSTPFAGVCVNAVYEED